MNYGVASAPAIFQEIIDKVLSGLEDTLGFLDDILIGGECDNDSLNNVDQVLGRLEEYGIKVNKSKCEFLQKSVTYLGYVIEAEGIHPCEEKVNAIKSAPAPSNVTELRSWLGLLNYYSKFLNMLSTTLRPLNRLLEKDVVFQWSNECQIAFDKCKAELSSDKVLVHYDVKLPLQLACDASPYGVGAVLSHIMPDGSDCPVAFASRTLSAAEKGYDLLNKEALSIIFGFKKFHKYLYC